eukprot:snap_masked-scaffold_5-processed-gene-6.11-mRNA-1 protein AED:1.00 eAED:1.00 QI:0/0/0/0/1/1/2/0/85
MLKERLKTTAKDELYAQFRSKRFSDFVSSCVAAEYYDFIGRVINTERRFTTNLSTSRCAPIGRLTNTLNCIGQVVKLRLTCPELH